MLLDLIDEHRGAFEYDWRARFHLPLTAMPDKMGWGEGYRLSMALVTDPSSQVSVAIQGWKYPATRAEIVMLELFDLQHMSKAKRKPKPYPRPWDIAPIKHGAGTSLTVAEYRALKNAASS